MAVAARCDVRRPPNHRRSGARARDSRLVRLGAALPARHLDHAPPRHHQARDRDPRGARNCVHVHQGQRDDRHRASRRLLAAKHLLVDEPSTQFADVRRDRCRHTLHRRARDADGSAPRSSESAAPTAFSIQYIALDCGADASRRRGRRSHADAPQRAFARDARVGRKTGDSSCRRACAARDEAPRA